MAQGWLSFNLWSERVGGVMVSVHRLAQGIEAGREGLPWRQLLIGRIGTEE
jgi:hypothetical protein